MTTPADIPVLEAAAVTKHFPVHGGQHRGRVVHAVENATLRLYRGRIVALVGESGSGKTTLARLLALLYPATGGEIRLNGQPVRRRSARAQRAYYRSVQLIFQDPFASLNTTHRVRYILSRPLKTFASNRVKNEDIDRQVHRLLERVSLTPTTEFIDKFPYQLSGGQRQRVAIARALAANPLVLLGDEPVSMLDVSIRLDILNLLGRLRAEEDVAILYITHDIASARYSADEINVMYAGQLVEGGSSEAITQAPRHPYTRLLLDASPDPDRAESDNPGGLSEDDPGEPPSLTAPPTGCRFHPRCPHAMPVCSTRFPDRTDFGDGQWTHCWLYSGQPT